MAELVGFLLSRLLAFPNTIQLFQCGTFNNARNHKILTVEPFCAERVREWWLREHLERQGLPAVVINRLQVPVNDLIVARQTDGSIADFTSPDFLQYSAAYDTQNKF